jgi:predicted cupin superfamily sugar epimerase
LSCGGILPFWQPERKGDGMTEAQKIIAHLGLERHPEGGWYRQTWAGPDVQGRASGTAILFLLAAGERSHWHRVDADEIWLWHAGAPLVLGLAETAAGPAREVEMGAAVLSGQMVQAVVPKGWWQAARTTGAWSLVSCTVSPGFRFDGFELAAPGFDIPTAS